MMTEPVRKTSLENKRLRNCDYFAIILKFNEICRENKNLTKLHAGFLKVILSSLYLEMFKYIQNWTKIQVHRTSKMSNSRKAATGLWLCEARALLNS